MNLAVHKLRVNVKSLSAEAKFIRQEIKRAADVDHKNALAYHRSQRVKPESRLAQLAMAYLRGRPYRSAEAKTHNQVLFGDLANKIAKFTDVYSDNRKAELRTQVRDWLAA